MIGAHTPVKTYSPKPRDIERRWYVVDADGAVLGRLASEVAKILRGKHKPIFAPHMDTGDHVIVVNAKGVRVTGGKEEKKIYFHHSGYPGGLSKVEFSRVMSRRPVQVVEKAIRGMLPKNRLGRQMARKLAVYEGSEHPHQAQKPVALPLGDIPKWEGLPKPRARSEPAPAPKAPRQKEGPSGRRDRTGTAKRAAGSRTRKAAAKAPSARRAAAATGTSSRRKSQTSRKADAASTKASTRSSTSRGAKSKAGAGEEKATPRRRSRKKTEKES
jgi:large subunit ribosomal protein L13